MNYPPPLPAAEQIDLCRRAQAGDIGARNRLVLTTMRLVLARAKALRKISNEVTFDDLAGEGALGVMRAIEKFDHSHGVKFITYAQHWIDNAIRTAAYRAREVKLGDVSRQVIATEYRAEVAAGLTHDEALQSIATARRMKLKTVSVLITQLHRVRPMSLNAPTKEDGSELGDLLAAEGDPEATAINESERAHVVGAIERALSTFPEREREILRRRYLAADEPETLQDVGRTYGICRERVRQIQAQAWPLFKKRFSHALSMRHGEPTVWTKEFKQQYSRGWWLRRKAKGLCVCGAKARPGLATCADHKPTPAEKKAYRALMRERGTCPSHPNTRVVPGTTRCADCTKARREQEQRRRRRRRAAGRCLLCGSRNAADSRCQTCKDARKARRQRLRGKLAAAATALLASCAGYSQRLPDVAGERDAATDAALTAWQQRIGPAPGCLLERDQLRWEVAPEAIVQHACVTDTLLSACMHYDRGAPVILIAADTPRSAEQLDELRAHELAHWISACSGRTPDGDPEHTDAVVFPGMVNATLTEMNR